MSTVPYWVILGWTIPDRSGQAVRTTQSRGGGESGSGAGSGNSFSCVGFLDVAASVLNG